MDKQTARKLFKEIKKNYDSVELGIGNGDYYVSVSIKDVYCDKLAIDRMLGISNRYNCHLNINGKKVYIEKTKRID